MPIAPHEGKEIQLVLEGVKPLATIDKDKDPEQYRRAFLTIDLAIDRQGEGLISITRMENTHLHAVFKLLSTTRANVLVRTPEEKHRLLGRLFGYNEEDIDDFINAGLKCACGQCKWEG
jgi:hypothetical protein